MPSPVNKDLAIRGLPNHVLTAVDDLLRSGRPLSEVARYIHTQGYLDDMKSRSLEKAVERYRKNNAVRLLPDPVLMVADEEESLSRLTEALPPTTTPRSYIEEMFEDIGEDVNEMGILIAIIRKHFERVVKLWELEENMPMPLDAASKEQDRLVRYLEKSMAIKQRLGILPRVPQQVEVRSRSARLNVDVGAGEMAKMVIEKLLEGDVDGSEEPFRETKRRLRKGLIE